MTYCDPIIIYLNDAFCNVNGSQLFIVISLTSWSDVISSDIPVPHGDSNIRDKSDP